MLFVAVASFTIVGGLIVALVLLTIDAIANGATFRKDG